MAVFPEACAACRELLQGDEPLLVSGTLDVGEESCKLMANEIVHLRDVKEKMTSKVHFRLSSPGLDEQQLRTLRGICERYRGNCQALLHLVIPNRSETLIQLPETLKVAACDEIMDDTKKLFGYNVVTFE